MGFATNYTNFHELIIGIAVGFNQRFFNFKNLDFSQKWVYLVSRESYIKCYEEKSSNYIFNPCFNYGRKISFSKMVF